MFLPHYIIIITLSLEVLMKTIHWQNLHYFRPDTPDIFSLLKPLSGNRLETQNAFIVQEP